MRDDTMLYKCPGPYDIHDGHYDYIIVDASEDGALDAALADGWSLTTPEARAVYEAAQSGDAPIEAKATKKATATKAAPVW